jgi:FtsP/CotA-like multicopper oxidase with cupredoxin domain
MHRRTHGDRRTHGTADPGGPPAADVADLRGETVGARRTIAFTMGMGGGVGMSFGFDGREFNPDRIDQSVTLGTIEEWTLANLSSMDRPFHLHVWPMQVVAASDVDPAGRPDWRDVVIVPAREQVTMRIRFADSSGHTVCHCHVLDHEDQEMMGIIAATP